LVGELGQCTTCSAWNSIATTIDDVIAPLDARLAPFDDLNQLELHYEKSEIRRFLETLARRNESRFLPRA
jgi:hypothetical protein